MSSEDEEQLASLLKQFLRSIDERLSGAPTPQSAEEVLLHLEETDKNFHYEFVQHLRQRVETSLGCVVDKELGKLSREDGQHTVDSCHDALIHTAYQEMTQTLRATVTAAAERLLSSFDDDQLRKEEEMQHGRYADDCSDSGDSFNQCYTFIRQEQLQALAEKLDPSQPKEVRREALQALRHAPASDVLSCEGWARLRQNLCATLTEPDAELSFQDHVLRFFAKSFSSLPLNVTREIYSSLGRSVQSNFLSLKLSFPSGAAVLDINRPEISSLLKQMRLMNDFQKEATTFWIRHPEYMEEIIESTFSLLSVHGDSSPEKVLGPTDLLALLDVQAAWFTKWMHGSYSRTLVLRLLQSKYKNLPIGSVYSGKELQYAVVVHSLCVLGKVLLYANGRKLFPIKAAARKPVTLTDLVVILINIMYQHHQPLCSDSSHALCPSSLVIATLSAMCERTECADQCLHQAPVVQTLMVPTKLKCPAATLPLIADVLARMVNTDRGLALFLYDRNLLMGPNEILSLRAVCGAFISVCGQMYKTCEGLRVLEAYSLHKAAVAAWRKQMWEETLLDSLLNFAATPKGVLLLHQTGAMQECVSHMFSRFNKKLQVSRREKFGYGVMVTQVAATGAGAMALQRSGYVGALVLELWSALECGNEDVRVVRPEPTSMEPIDRSCLKSFLSLVNLLSSSQSVWQLLFGQPLANKSEYTLREVPSSVPDLIDRLIAVNSTAKIRSLFHYEQSHTFGLLLNVLCSSLDSFLLLESQYNICAVLLQSQRDNAASFILDNASLERNHTLVRVAVVGGPSERRLPPRALQEEPELRDFLTSPRNATTEDSWMETCRRLYRKVMTAGHHDYPGHDWLTSTVFLMMSGDWRRSLRLLRHLSSVLTSAFIWPANVHASLQVDLAVRVAESGMSPLYWSSAHYVEMLLKDELPQAHAAFRMSGFTPSQICIHWLTQCFWNFLDWPEICHYVCICALMGADYQVYACLAVLKHLQPLLLQQTQARRLQVFLKEPIQGFRFCDYLDFMQLLERRYRNLVLSDMKSI
uniref:Protein broad-minded n=1 Tax=Hippocampus comes TaxID=109280 RepID=A0A3Q3DFD7_HIPCM